jgi:hypothetical protein
MKFVCSALVKMPHARSFFGMRNGKTIDSPYGFTAKYEKANRVV